MCVKQGKLIFWISLLVVSTLAGDNSVAQVFKLMKFFFCTFHFAPRALGKFLLTVLWGYSKILIKWPSKKQKIQCLRHPSIWLIGRLFIINNPECLEMSVAKSISRWILMSWVAAESSTHSMWRITFDKIVGGGDLSFSNSSLDMHAICSFCEWK